MDTTHTIAIVVAVAMSTLALAGKVVELAKMALGKADKTPPPPPSPPCNAELLAAFESFKTEVATLLAAHMPFTADEFREWRDTDEKTFKLHNVYDSENMPVWWTSKVQKSVEEMAESQKRTSESITSTVTILNDIDERLQTLEKGISTRQP